MRILASLYKKIRCMYLLTACMALQPIAVHAAIIEVTSEADAGIGTFRQAIIDANVSGDSIAFAPNVNFIALLSPLPVITNSITIDGLSTVINGQLVTHSCDDLPSPVCNPQEFSAALRVTIDGSAIPSTTPLSGFGLRTTTDPTIIGLRIQNFTGSADDPDAIGIQGGTGTAVPTIRCCEITNILSGPPSLTTGTENTMINGNAVGIDRADTVQKCLIRSIKTAPVFNPAAGTSPFLGTGNAIGIHNFAIAHLCNVTTIDGGDIIANDNQSGYDFLLGQTIGFGVGILENSITNVIEITDSVAHAISGGSILTNYTDGIIIPVNNTDLLDSLLLYNTCGAYISRSMSTITIENSSFCTIQTGSITTCNDNMVITSPFAAGIFARGSITSLHNNTVTNVNGNHICLGGSDSLALLSTATGIVSSAPNFIAMANTISYITAGCSRIEGECSQIIPHLLFTYPIGLDYFLPPAAGIISYDEVYAAAVSVSLQNNQISHIDGKTHVASGINASISSAGSVGAAIVQTDTSTAEHNTIQAIQGATLSASHAALIARNVQASAGLQLLSGSIEAHNNTIQTVCETSIKTLGATPTINAVIINPDDDTDRRIFPLFTSGIYADGLSLEATISSAPLVNITENTITNICGSHTQSNGSTQGSIATGISMRKPNITGTMTQNTPAHCPQGSIGSIAQNSISSITGGTNAPGYGIVLNQDLYIGEPETLSIGSILNNTISTITGQPLVPYTLTKQEILAECVTGSGNGNSEFTILPFAPYGPSTGINLLVSGCASVAGNIIYAISSPDNQARGISTTASSDVDITDNAIRTITGPGIFVGGASADLMLITESSFTPEEFEAIFPSVRNTIFNNSTQADMTQGIELGVVDWDDFFTSISAKAALLRSLLEMQGDPVMPRLTIIGNHDQVAAQIDKIICNRNGTITIDITFSDKQHPNSTFIIQFFKNSTNMVPHGEEYISPFTTDFAFTTNENGNARVRFVFVPAHKIESGDTISSHVTLTVDGTVGTSGSELSPDVGDTSEFSVQQSGNQSPLASVVSCSSLSGYPGFSALLSSKTK